MTGDDHMLKSARTVSVLTLASRVLGLLRDALTAQLLGAGWVNDALSFAWTIPNAARRLFGEGALGSAFVPVFTRTLERDGPERARHVGNVVVSTVGVVLALLSALLIAGLGLVPPERFAALFDLSEVRHAELVLWLMRVLAPYLAVICVIAQFMGMLNATGRFAVPAFGPILLNIVWIAAVFAASAATDAHEEQVRWIAWGILVATALQFVWHLPFLARAGVAFRPTVPRITPELREVGALFVPMVLGMGAGQINVIVDRTVALRALAEGGTTHVYYGMRVMQFPLGLVAVALGTAVYPTLLRLVTRRDERGVAATASQAFRTNMIMCLPAATGIVLLAEPIVALLFGRGEFDAAAVARTSSALVGYAVGIPFAGLVILLNRVFYATGDARTPMKVGLSLVLVNAALDVVLVGPLGELGLGVATSATAALTAWLLLRGFRARLTVDDGASLFAGVGAIVAITAAMALVVLAGDALLASRLETHGGAAAALRVALGATLGVVSYTLLAARFCPREWREITALLPGRRGAD